MVFKCQEDSFLKEFATKVVKCEKSKEPVVDYGKISKFEGYEVTLENTILFAAGGGQPHDLGWLNGKEVVQVVRKGSEALHYTKEPFEVGAEITQEVDWRRRFDHMQQHSGQHLLSAILEKEHNLYTTAWWLGAEESHVELDSTVVTEDVIKTVERRCNELIREAIPVNVKFCKITDPDISEAHTRGLPKDCMETIRIICIGDVDENMCCGTHVANLSARNRVTVPGYLAEDASTPLLADGICEAIPKEWPVPLSQLQMIKLLGAEPGKKGKTNLKFLVGSRVTKVFQTMLDREKAMTGLLKNDPSRHEELVQKMQKNLKVTNKNLQNVLNDLAQYEIDEIKKQSPKPKYVFMFKKEATPDFNRNICKGLENEGIFMFLASEDPEKPKEGQILIQGPEEHCNVLGSQITELLKGKGAFKNGKFQGKAGDLGGLAKCKRIIEEYFKSLQ